MDLGIITFLEFKIFHIIPVTIYLNGFIYVCIHTYTVYINDRFRNILFPFPINLQIYLFANATNI